MNYNNGKVKVDVNSMVGIGRKPTYILQFENISSNWSVTRSLLNATPKRWPLKLRVCVPSSFEIRQDKMKLAITSQISGTVTRLFVFGPIVWENPGKIRKKRDGKGLLSSVKS